MAGVFLLPVVYVLSFTPAGMIHDGVFMSSFYRPVRRLTHDSPLSEPLLRWADIFGRRELTWQLCFLEFVADRRNAVP